MERRQNNKLSCSAKALPRSPHKCSWYSHLSGRMQISEGPVWDWSVCVPTSVPSSTSSLQSVSGIVTIFPAVLLYRRQNFAAVCCFNFLAIAKIKKGRRHVLEKKICNLMPLLKWLEGWCRSIFTRFVGCRKHVLQGTTLWGNNFHFLWVHPLIHIICSRLWQCFQRRKINGKDDHTKCHQYAETVGLF